MPDYQDKKELRSLLLYTISLPIEHEKLLSDYEELLDHNSYEYEIPPLETVFLEGGDTKILFDFSTHIGLKSSYIASIDDFFRRYLKFIEDLVFMDPNRVIYLSALMNIDEELAVFELNIPKIPGRLNASRNFQFDYSVWHIPSETLQ